MTGVIKLNSVMVRTWQVWSQMSYHFILAVLHIACYGYITLFIALQTVTGSDGASRLQKKTGHILWFKFNEGYSNAVRRPIKMKDLL